MNSPRHPASGGSLEIEKSQELREAIDDLMWHREELRELRQARSRIVPGNSKIEIELASFDKRALDVKIQRKTLNCLEASRQCDRACLEYAREQMKNATTWEERQQREKEWKAFNVEYNARQARTDQELLALARKSGDIRRELRMYLDRLQLDGDAHCKRQSEAEIEELTAQLDRTDKAYEEAVAREKIRSSARRTFGQDID